MRKNFIVVGLLFVMALVSFIAVFLYVNGQQDQIKIEEKVLAGDPRAAAGIKISVKACDSSYGKLLWNTDYEIKGLDGLVKTESHFYNVKGTTYKNDWSPDDVSFSESFYGGYGSSDAKELIFDNLATKKIIDDVGSRTKPRSTHQEEVLLKDYFEYLPMCLYVAINGLYINNAEDEDSYFKVPTPDDYTADVTVVKNSSNQVYSYELSNYTSRIEVETTCVGTNSGCYLALAGAAYKIDMDGEEKTAAEIELPDEMSGIHFIPFIPAKDMDNGFSMDLKNASLSYPLAADVQVLDMQLSADKNKIFLFTAERKQVYLSVIDIDSMKQLQKIHLYQGKSETYTNTLKEEDGKLLVIAGTGQFYLFTQKGNQYEMELSHNLYQIKRAKKLDFSAPYLSFDYDGDRMALAVFNGDCSNILFLFDQKGMKYVGYYKNNVNHKDVAIDLRNDSVYRDYAVVPAVSTFKASGNRYTPVEGIKVRL